MLSALFAAACDATPPSAPEIVRPVFVTTLAPSAATAEHRFAATLEARVQTELAFRTGGRVAERVVEVGDRVRSGEPIARLDPADNRLAR
jgi:multidrug efflux pump subunit AcrA (membrane-fusion protein)